MSHNIPLRYYGYIYFSGKDAGLLIQLFVLYRRGGGGVLGSLFCCDDVLAVSLGRSGGQTARDPAGAHHPRCYVVWIDCKLCQQTRLLLLVCLRLVFAGVKGACLSWMVYMLSI